MNDVTYWALYRGLRLYLGLWVKDMRLAKVRTWLRKPSTSKVCAVCHEYVPYKKRTVDHIIPQRICKDMEMPGLLWDERNFQMLCQDCNIKKGDSVQELTPAVMAAIERRLSSLTISTTL